MKVVGIRELKDRLSEYLRQVRGGEEVLVTDRGQVVAEIAPPYRTQNDPDLPAGLLALARRGVLSLGGRNDPSLYPQMPPLMPDGTARKLLDEERGDR